MNGKRGFTLIELLIVMTLIALLLSIAVPRYFGSVDRAKESVLRENLASLRDSIDKFYSDNDRYPINLNELIEKRYLRKIPEDPMTESATTWVTYAASGVQKKESVYDVKSGARGKARNGTNFSDW